MSQVESTTPTQTRRERVEAFLKAFEWSWTTAVVFSLGLVFDRGGYRKRAASAHP